MGGIFIFHGALLVIAIIGSIVGKWYNRWWRQSPLSTKFSPKYTDNSETKTKRFYSFAPSVGLRASMFEGPEQNLFPIDSDVPNDKEILGKSFNAVDQDFTTNLYSDQIKRIDELASDMNDQSIRIDELASDMKLVLQKLDKMTAIEGRNDPYFSILKGSLDTEEF